MLKDARIDNTLIVAIDGRRKKIKIIPMDLKVFPIIQILKNIVPILLLRENSII